MDRFQKFKISFALTLLVMILFRLVWMEIRQYRVTIEPKASFSLYILGNHISEKCSSSQSLTYPVINPPATAEDLGAAYSYFSSTGYMAIGWFACQFNYLSDDNITKFNQWLLVFTVLCLCLSVRFMTGSWVIALIAGVTIFSRGSILKELGKISIDPYHWSLVALWLCTASHYIRTGAKASFLALSGIGFFGVLIDPSWTSLLISFPILLLGGFLIKEKLSTHFKMFLISKKNRQRQTRSLLANYINPASKISDAHQLGETIKQIFGLGMHEIKPADMHYESNGHLLQSLQIPFALWINFKARWKNVLSRSLVYLVACVLFLFLAKTLIYYVSPESTFLLKMHTPSSASPAFLTWTKTWVAAYTSVFDAHLVVSLALIFLCGLQSPIKGAISFFEWSWLLLIVFSTTSVMGLLFDYIDSVYIANLASEGIEAPKLNQISFRNVIHWFEPLILSSGIAAFYQLAKIVYSKIEEDE